MDAQNDDDQNQPEPDSDDQTQITDPKLLKDMKAHSQIFKEKHSKYLQYLKGDFQFDNNKSASLTIQFPLEYKKLLLLSLVEAVVKKVVVRSVPGVDRCSLIMPDKAGQIPHLFV